MTPRSQSESKTLPETYKVNVRKIPPLSAIKKMSMSKRKIVVNKEKMFWKFNRSMSDRRRKLQIYNLPNYLLYLTVTALTGKGGGIIVRSRFKEIYRYDSFYVNTSK